MVAQRRASRVCWMCAARRHHVRPLGRNKLRTRCLHHVKDANKSIATYAFLVARDRCVCTLRTQSLRRLCDDGHTARRPIFVVWCQHSCYVQTCNARGCCIGHRHDANTGQRAAVPCPTALQDQGCANRVKHRLRHTDGGIVANQIIALHHARKPAVSKVVCMFCSIAASQRCKSSPAGYRSDSC